MAVLCVDAGTTMVKAVLFGPDGREQAVARQQTTVSRGPGGTSEQDMDAVWQAVVRAARAVTDQQAGSVDLVAVTGQGDGCWLVDRDGRPTGPAILWNDGRAAAILDRWDADGVLTAAYRRNGTLCFPGTSGAILRWLHTHDPERLAASHRALSCDGWLFYRLSRELVTDESDAANPFLDIRTRRYSPELLALYGMPWAERLLPEIRDDAHRVAQLHPAAAAELGIPAGLPVVLAPFDIPATAIGIGAIAPGDACAVLGTTLSIERVVAEPDTAGLPAGMTLPSGVGSTFVRSLATMSGTEVVRWGMEMIGLDGPDDLAQLAATAEPGARGLFFQPYLSPAGERAPFRDPAARGCLLGLSFEHGRPELARALLEGMCYVVRECLEFAGDPATELRVCGGGARSAFWCQLLADVTGVPTSRAADDELGAKGALLTALAATGRAPSTPAAAQWYVNRRDTFLPDPATGGRYTELFASYLDAREATAASWPALARVRAGAPGGVRQQPAG